MSKIQWNVAIKQILRAIKEQTYVSYFIITYTQKIHKVSIFHFIYDFNEMPRTKNKNVTFYLYLQYKRYQFF